jgi:hypothetical protein
LVNGGFEDLRGDGTPYGWRKVGGELRASTAVRAEGKRSAALMSGTDSTKWLYQTVKVEGNAYYRLQAKALRNDPGVRETLLRVSWYEGVDGSGIQLSTADSEALIRQSPDFAVLDTGAVRAPPKARSAKLRLMIRPASPRVAVVYFDDVRFRAVVAPPTEGALDSVREETEGERGSGRPTVQRASAHETPRSAWAGPTLLANVRREPQTQNLPGAADGRPTWPLWLALGVPVAGLAIVAAHASWKARLAGRNKLHL